MKITEIQAVIGAAILLLSTTCEAKHSHSHQQMEAVHKRHNHKRAAQASQKQEGIKSGLAKRATCTFPTGKGLVSVTPESENAGWALSPDQPCTAGSYCPYACPPGEVMNQWNPLATSYTYPLSMDGGLYCNDDGEVEYPYPNKDLCVSGVGTVAATNECSEAVAFCQTVLPGNEAMLIPTLVDSDVTLAIPGVDYWCGTASHFYINPPGVSTADACIWSDGSKPLGNWAPYVAGGNQDDTGATYAKIGWNPIWIASDLATTMPNFGVRFECPDGAVCNGLPCSIDPSTDGIGGVTAEDEANGAGGANFCVVTVPKGVTASIVVFPIGSAASSTSVKASSTTKAATTSSTKAPTTTSSSAAKTTSSTTLVSSTSSKVSSSSSSSSSEEPKTTSKAKSSSSAKTTTFSSASSSSTAAPQILFQASNSTATSSSASVASNVAAGVAVTGTAAGSSEAAASSSAAADKKNAAEGTSVSGSFLGLSILLVAASMML